MEELEPKSGQHTIQRLSEIQPPFYLYEQSLCGLDSESKTQVQFHTDPQDLLDDLRARIISVPNLPGRVVARTKYYNIPSSAKVAANTENQSINPEILLAAHHYWRNTEQGFLREHRASTQGRQRSLREPKSKVISTFLMPAGRSYHIAHLLWYVI